MSLPKKLLQVTLITTFSLAVMPHWVFAERVVNIQSGGKIRLENGSEILFAGIELESYAIPVVKALAQGRDISFEEETKLAASPQCPACKAGYVFIQSKEIQFPFKKGKEPRTSRLMLNEFLIRWGLAAADHESQYKHKEWFLRIEQEALKSGERPSPEFSQAP